MKTIILITSLLSIIFSNVFAEQQAMGTWRTHFAYNQVKGISQSDEKVYAISTEGALFSIGKYDDAIEIYSKIYGLNDNIVSFIKHSHENNALVIVYDNSNIDILTDDGEIYNIPDVYNKNLGHSKKINDIKFNDKYAYLACDFGIIVLDLKRYEVKDTYIIGEGASYITINNISINNQTIYAAAEDKVLYADINNKNLANYQNWNSLNGLPSSEIRNFAAYKSNQYLLSKDSTIFELANNQWSKINSNVTHICEDGDRFWYILSSGYAHSIDNSISFKTFYCRTIESDYDDSNIIWHSDTRGISKYFINKSAASFFKPSGPITKYTWRIKYANGKMYVVPGGRWTSQYNRLGEIMIYDGNNWLNINNADIKAQSEYRVNDLVDITVNPFDKDQFFVASYGAGILEFRNNKLVKHYTAHNSGIESIFASADPSSNDFNHYQRVDGLTYDKDGNLWMLNRGQAQIKYMKPNGDFVNLAHSQILKFGTLQDILIDQKNDKLKFVLIPRSTSTSSTALFVFNDNATPSINDDQTRLFANFKDYDGNVFAPINFHCIEQDNDGSIWIGTTTGVAVIDNTQKIFNSNMAVNRIKIPRNDGTGLADYLLSTEKINDIAVDGANRKWIATETSGVFLVSPDGLETVHHFTTENSPMLANNVQCIGINNETGEVFFGTSNGLISFQSDAIDGGENFENVHAFPNPVRPEYSGLISITGLVENSIVRITDVNGHVVYETRSNGGIATWNGLIKSGRRAATGVYIVMCVDSSGKKHATTKILFIN